MSFDFWGWLLSALFFFNTCSTSTPSPVKLNMPKTEGQEKDYSKVSTKLTLILLKDGNGFAYEGLDVNTGFPFKKVSLRQTILTAKQRFSSPEFIVLIKPTADADYSSTVDVLDEMTINKIDRYDIVNLTPEESAKFHVKDGQAN